MKLKNRVGYVENEKLGINKPGGHYVYVNKVSKDRKKVNVNTITSLDRGNRMNSELDLIKVNKIRKGLVLPLPKHNGNNFTKWSGVSKNNIKNVKADDIDFSSNKRINDKWTSLINKFIK